MNGFVGACLIVVLVHGAVASIPKTSDPKEASPRPLEVELCDESILIVSASRIEPEIDERDIVSQVPCELLRIINVDPADLTKHVVPWIRFGRMHGRKVP